MNGSYAATLTAPYGLSVVGVLRIGISMKSDFVSLVRLQDNSSWCGRKDSNLHAEAPEPKSGVSANSTTSAWILSLMFLILIKIIEESQIPRLCGDPTGNRTRVTAVKGRCLNLLTMGPKKKPATS